MNTLIIFDLDGTLALIEHRLHFIQGKEKDWVAFYKACGDDLPNKPVVEIFISMDISHNIWIFSGRGEEAREETEAWLHNHDLFFDKLFMRPAGNYTPDDQLKERWLAEMTPKQREQLLCVFDDRDKVVKMWRRNNVTCLQVAPGDF